ncbi:hypothetical protein FSARC_2967 [Fusarium sarcochroum]|uniref:PD-(D/E)XK nuclease-like domain-containing protein n=1 Tax=Fusarium sarcochroum TaxID=1208366 RepID=A0A8H4XD14_9HYPO|nr:hypothetical protein FSARC_2967 [Fusarium sarcochroum]
MSTTNYDRITRWLSEIDSSKHTQPPALKSPEKRPLPSPPMSYTSSHRDLSSPKRRRLNDIDPDKTPTAQNKITPIILPQDSQSEQASTASSASTSRNSGRSSPSKGLAALRNAKLVDYLSFDGQLPVPRPLNVVVRDIKRLAKGNGIIAIGDADNFRRSSLNLGAFRDELDEPSSAIDSLEIRPNLGQLPNLDTLVELWEEATYHQQHSLPEVAWNTAVHYPLLQAALRHARVNDSEHQQAQYFRIKPMNISSINVAGRFIPLTSRYRHNKRIDFCLFLDVTEHSLLETAIEAKVESSQHDSINHTETPWLSRFPISIGIETKKTGEDWHTALEQMTIWMSAHWKRLQDLTGQVDSLPFLPGIIVQGHDWYFVASTLGGLVDGKQRQVLIWNKVLIGSTEGLQGICQIVAVLQYLTKWVVEVYYPWLQSAVLMEELEQAVALVDEGHGTRMT